MVDDDTAGPWGPSRKDRMSMALRSGDNARPEGTSRSSEPQGGAEPSVPFIPASPATTPSGFGIGRTAHIEFSGARNDYGHLTLRGLLLYVPTFGFYRFWLKTDQRRFFWLHTSLEGSAFEYRGTARELLIGFLLAIAIYLPISIGYSLIGLYAETVQAFASIPFVIFSALLGYFASYRARRYRLTRTIYRGVRFWMDGSAWKFAFRAFLWLLFVIVTLGIAYPWMVAALERAKMRNSHFGDLRGDFDGTGGQLIKALALPCIGLLVGSFIPFVNFFVWAIMVPAIGVVIARWTLNGTSFGPVRASSAIRWSALIGPALITMLLVLLFGAVWMGIGWLVVQSALPTGKSVSLNASLLSNWRFAVLGLGWSMLGLLGVYSIKAIFFDFEKTRRILQSITLSHLEALDGVEAKGEAASAFGEGLADALGSDGF